MNFPSNDLINLIDLKDVLNIVSDEDNYKQYINLSAGTEHYKLLGWIGNQYNNKTIIEIGSFKGFSGASLAINESNIIYSFDIVDEVVLNPVPKNLNFIIDNYENRESLFKDVPFIFYDTVHDGIQEDNFIKWLERINYKGIIMFDDIFLNNEMKSFWNNINYKKLDITSLGHWSGTGIVWIE